MKVAYHLSACANRTSIAEHGLDWRRMGAVPGIAGSRRPETAGIYLARDLHEVAWFLTFARPLDVWRVDVSGLQLEYEREDEGWPVHRRPIPPDRLTLLVAGDASIPWSTLPEPDVVRDLRVLLDMLISDRSSAR